jgi:hypothetical protein
MNKISILGTEYEIIKSSEIENPKLKDCNGLCEQYSKRIILWDMKTAENEVMLVENVQELKNEVLRHEIIHAFLGESGLRNNSDWAENEEMVDWIAIQFHKIADVFKELGI